MRCSFVAIVAMLTSIPISASLSATGMADKQLIDAPGANQAVFPLKLAQSTPDLSPRSRNFEQTRRLKTPSHARRPTYQCADGSCAPLSPLRNQPRTGVTGVPSQGWGL